MHAPDPSLPWVSRLLFRMEVGSSAYGTSVEGSADYDEVGIFAETWDQWIGISSGDETINYRPERAQGERSQAGDYDLVVHSARKWARLCASGNPSMLAALYGPVTYAAMDAPMPPRDAFFSKRAISAFLGYAKQQRERVEGVRGGKHTNRPELVEKYGFDTKYAMHMVRLGVQGIEYMKTGKLVLPIQEPFGQVLRDIRVGEYTLDECIEMSLASENHLMKFRNDSNIPDHPDIDTINLWLYDIWSWNA